MVYKSHADLPKPLKGIYKDFQKEKLIGIMEELGLERDNLNTRAMVVVIANDLEENGIPDADDCGDDLFKFLLDANYIDDDGNIVEIAEAYEDDEEDDEHDLISNDEDDDDPLAGKDVPECFTYADSRDPACGRCTLFTICSAERVMSRPPCFGKLFDMNAEECRNCLEFGDCKDVMKEN